MTVVAQCLSGHRPQPFISDQAAHLERHRSIVLARDRIDPFGWTDTPIYRSQDSPGWTGSDFTQPAPDFDDIPDVFVEALRDHAVGLLHAHHGMFALEFLALHRYARVPLIVSFYGFDASGFPKATPANAHRLDGLFEAATLVLAMSDDMRRDLVSWGCSEDRIVVHSPGVDLERFPYITPRGGAPVSILCVSDFSAKKGVRTLIDAFALVHQREPRTCLRLVGAPTSTALEEYKRIKERIAELGLVEAVQLDGWREHSTLSDVYRESDVFVLPSETALDGSKEGIPAVILEAMASGLPVVSTLHAGIPEAVVDGETGFLVSERDVNGLAVAIERLVADMDARLTMGAAGRSQAEAKFDVRARRERVEQVYDEVLRDL